MEYRVTATRIDAGGPIARPSDGEGHVGTDLAGRPDAFNPVELTLTALAACMIKGVERVAPMLDFAFDAVEIALGADRQDAPPRITRIRDDIRVTTKESDRRLSLLHRNVLKYETISDTCAGAAPLEGRIARV